jgi:recombination protein RecR
VADIYSPLLNQLIEAFQCLPGVGVKTAQRMAFHLLDKDRDAGGRLAATLERAVRSIRNCERCRMLTEEPVCRFCGSDKRDRSQLCIVETPADLLAIEQSGAYSGGYFVLMGHLSPIDGVGPAELGLELLERRFSAERFAEIVLAPSVTVEVDATAHRVAALAHKHGLRASRIAYGVPVGGELEYIDGGTLARALSGRRDVEESPSEGGRR